MVAPEVMELYQRFVPRWFKVIRWREMAQRTVEKQKFALPCVYLSLFYATFAAFNPYPLYLCIYKPQTEEERLALKRDTIVMASQRDWKMDQYTNGRPPVIDVWRRRQNYPQYYGNKYDGYERDGFASP
jgi:hypothetical protein